MELSTLKKLTADGKIFSVLFVKRTDGALRRMVARTGVKFGITGEDRNWDPDDKGLLTVYDMQAKGYRMIPADAVQEIRVRKETIRF